MLTFPPRYHFYLAHCSSRLSETCNTQKILLPSKEREREQEKNQNHQSLILFPSSGRWYSRRGGTVTYTPPLSPSWGPPTTPEIELPQGATWRLNALLLQTPQGPIVHSSLSGNPCHCNLQPITFPRDSLICVDPEWTSCGCVETIHTPRTCSIEA